MAIRLGGGKENLIMRVKNILISLVVLGILTGCAGFNKGTARTDRVSRSITLHVTDYASVQEMCPFSQPVYGCANDKGYIVMYGWKEGNYVADIDVQFLSWSEIAKKCGKFYGAFGDPSCYEDGVLYTYDYRSDREINMGVIGEILANEVLHLTPDNLYKRERTLGHEFMAHVMGSGDVRESLVSLR